MTASDTTDDRTLVEAVLARGDEAAFRALYRRHTPALLGLASRLSSGRRAEAEDVVQEAWIRAVRGLRVFAWRSSLKTWLSGFVINCARERRRGPSAQVVDWTAARNAPAPSPGIDPLDLERALASLPEGYREILILHDVEGFTHDEIASLLGVEPGTSKSQLSRARRALRSRLGEVAEAKKGP